MYKEFVIYEKRNSESFLSSERIVDRKFDETEYKIVRKIFDKKEINEVYKAIDYLISKHKLN